MLAFADEAEPSTVIGDDGHSESSESRTSSTIFLKHDETPIVNGLAERVSDTINIPLGHAEEIQLLRYEIGQEYKPHFDAFEKYHASYREIRQSGWAEGNRVITTMGYLTDVYKGGQTWFPELGITIAPKAGRLLLWENCIDEKYDEPHPQSKHGALPVIEGTKVCFTIWFRENELHA